MRGKWWLLLFGALSSRGRHGARRRPDLAYGAGGNRSEVSNILCALCTAVRSAFGINILSLKCRRRPMAVYITPS